MTVKPERSPSYRLNQLANRINVLADRVVRKNAGITLTEWRILTAVAGEGGISQQRLIKLVAVDRSVVSRSVLALCNRELLRREADSDDGRKSRLFLTAAGREVYEENISTAMLGDKILLEGFSEQECKTLFQLLSRLEANIPRISAATMAEPEKQEDD